MTHANDASGQNVARGTHVPRGAPAPGAAAADEISRLLDEVKSLQERLAEAERLAVLGQLTATIAHEFNNLLTPVLSYSEMALERPRDAALTRKALERAFEGSTKAGQISQAILSLTAGFGGLGPAGAARGDGSGMGGADVGAAVDGALRCLGRDLGKDRIILRREIAEGTRAAISAIGLQQVVLNLVLNARRAMLGNGGTLTVRGAVVADDDVVSTISVATDAWSHESRGASREAGAGGHVAHGHVAQQESAGLALSGKDGGSLRHRPRSEVGGTGQDASRKEGIPTSRGKWVVVMVGDTGRGMSAAELARVLGEGGGSRESRVESREWGAKGHIAHGHMAQPEGAGALGGGGEGGSLRHRPEEQVGGTPPPARELATSPGGPGEGGAVARGGAGLGLMLCRKLVAAAGGWMGGVSEVGRGTVVWVVVPWVGEGGCEC